MANKLFAEKLGSELDSLGMPERLDERISAFSEFLNIPKFKAEAYLSGIFLPDEQLLQTLATELEVNPEWLIGKSTEKHKRKTKKESP